MFFLIHSFYYHRDFLFVKFEYGVFSLLNYVLQPFLCVIVLQHGIYSLYSMYPFIYLKIFVKFTIGIIELKILTILTIFYG